MSNGVFRQLPQPTQKRRNANPAAPTNYELATLTGSSTPTGAITKSITRSLSGPSVPTGAITRSLTKAGLAGSSTATGHVIPGRQVLGPSLAGSSTPTGSFGPPQLAKIVGGSCTPTGSLKPRTLTKAQFTGSSTPTGAVAPTRIITRSFAGSSTPTGAIAGKTLTRQFTGSSTPVGGVGGKTATRRLVGSTAPTGALTLIRHAATGTWLAPPEPVEEGPVIGSIVSWTETTPGVSRVLVETSINNGLTWESVRNNGPVPHLEPEMTGVQQVLARVTLWRPTGLDEAPRVDDLTILVDVNTSRTELVPLGVFPISEVDIKDNAEGVSIEVYGADLSQRLRDNTWEAIFTVPKDSNLGDVVKQVILNRLPGAVFGDFATTAEVAPASLIFGANATNDPLQDVIDIAGYCGMELFVDANGKWVMRPEPDPDLGSPVWVISDSVNPVVTDYERKLSDKDLLNYIVVVGETTGDTPPVRGVAADNDPESNTYWKGRLGKRSRTFVSKLVTSDAQATVAAQAKLLKFKYITETVQIKMVPNPALDAGDIVDIDRSRVKLAGAFLVDGCSIPFSQADLMTLTARKRKLQGSDGTSSGVGGLDGEETGGGPIGGGSGGSPRVYSTPGECLKIGANGATNHFKLQTAYTGGGSIVEESQSQIGAGFTHSPEFKLNTARTAVVHRVNLNAPTTGGSSNPRTELREMGLDGTTQMSFNGTSGDHLIFGVVKINHVPANKRSVCVMQLHNGSSDSVQILTRKIGGVLKLCYRINGTDDDAWTFGDYTLGTEVAISIQVTNGVGKLWYAVGSQLPASPTVTCGTGGVPSLTSISSGCYFKAGCYPQDTTDESSSDYAEMELRHLGHQHPGWPTPVVDPDDVSSSDARNFSLAYGACINASDSTAFTAIKAAKPDMFAILGDTWYKDGATPNWVADWTAKFSATNFAAMLADLPNPPIVSWSDHDFGYENNSTGLDNPSRTSSANAAFRTKFPDVQLASNTGIHRTFAFGRVRFIVLDMLTFKSPLGSTSSTSRTMLGSSQKTWYKNLLKSSEYPLIVVLGDGQIPGPAEDNQDEWRGYDKERAELATAVGQSPATVIYLNGDTHSLAYGHDQYGYDRVWQAAPFNNETKVKAGGEGYIATYPTNSTEGPIKQMWAKVQFVDNGTSITVTWRGYEGSTQRLSDSITVNA